MAATTPQSRKAKGRILQQEIRDDIMKVLGIPEEDIISTPMGMLGPDIILSSAARKRMPFAIEAKFQENLSLWKALEQAEAHAKSTSLEPAMVFRRSRMEPWVAIRFKTFLTMLLVISQSTMSVQAAQALLVERGYRPGDKS